VMGFLLFGFGSLYGCHMVLGGAGADHVPLRALNRKIAWPSHSAALCGRWRPAWGIVGRCSSGSLQLNMPRLCLC
jgi:hypothetical protein